MIEPIIEYKNRWIGEVYEELDDLEQFICEENPLMVNHCIECIRILLDDLEDIFNEHVRKEIRGEKSE